MNRIPLIAILVCWMALTGAALAQSSALFSGQGIPVTDPAQYAESIAHQISRERTAPLRVAMRQIMGGAELSSELEVSLTQTERFLGDVTGNEIVKLEDISLAGTVRRIYYLNSFPGKFLFTRYDFTRAPDGWVLTGLTYGASWNSVSANPVTPGWIPTP